MKISKIRYIKSPTRFFSLFFSAMGAGFALLAPGYKKAISPHFAERIMLAVCGVNECAYCSWLHTKTALEKGISDKEIADLLNGSFTDMHKKESVALIYAQHWSESEGQPSSEARKTVINYYGKKMTTYIERTIKLVTLGNLCCNTVYAKREMPDQYTRGICFNLAYMLSMPIAYGIKKGSGKTN